MPTELLEHQHELTTDDASVSFVFGTSSRPRKYYSRNRPYLTTFLFFNDL